MKQGLWTIIKLVYKVFLRPLVKKAIDDPDSEIDDFIMARLDALFEYKEGK
jgi:hypothetical protein